MEARDIRLFAIDKLIPPPGAEAEADQTLVDQLATSLEYEGLREPLVVVSHGEHRAWIRHGVHRWLAARKLGWKTIECVIDPQAKSKEQHWAYVVAENLVRSHKSGPECDAMVRQLIDLRETVIKASSADPEATDDGLSRQVARPRMRQTADSSKVTKIGRPKSARAEARKQVARATGKSVAAVARADQRAAKAETTKSESPVEMQVDELGNRIPDRLWPAWQALDKGMLHVRGPMKAAINYSREFRTAVEGLGETFGRWVQYANRWVNQFKGMQHELTTLRPAVVCQSCGGEGGNCTKCGGIGFFTHYQVQNMPELNVDGKKKLRAVEAMLDGDDDE